VSLAARRLFDAEVPSGFLYRSDFLTPDEEAVLAAEIARIEFSTFEMRGVVARRRVAFFGESYDAARAVTAGIPAFLMPLRELVARWANVDAEAFVMALINEYTPGSPIGWHRDAPQYDIVAGVSLLSPCRMRFRPYLRPRAHASARDVRRLATHEILLEPRSVYLLTGESRRNYEHHIPAVAALRYSITFRTARTRTRQDEVPGELP
jgi:2OG-Fe(II) oxygenase superfamily